MLTNPLPEFPGNGSFIIHFPQYNPQNPQSEGALIVNPCGSDLRGFNYIHLLAGSDLLPNGFNSWMDNELADTLTVNNMSYTSNALLDSGNPFSLYYMNVNSNNSIVGIGSTVKFTLGPPVTASTTFVVTKQQSGLDLVQTSNYEVRNVFGIQFFFDFDVLYDQKNGLIGVRRNQNN